MHMHPYGRSVMNIGYTVCRGRVSSVDSSDDRKRRISVTHKEGIMSVSIRHKRVKISTGDEIIIAHYQADGFLPKLAGIHNCSSGAWYCVRQADEYLEDWLHVYRVRTWHYALIVSIYLCVVGALLLNPLIGSCLGIALTVALWKIIKKMQTNKVLLSAVACRSLEVQLMIEFRDLAQLYHHS